MANGWSIIEIQACIAIGSILDEWDRAQLSCSLWHCKTNGQGLQLFNTLRLRVSHSFSVWNLHLNQKESNFCLWACQWQIEAMIYFFLLTQHTDCVTFRGKRLNLAHGSQVLGLEAPFVSCFFAAKALRKQGLPHVERKGAWMCFSLSPSGILESIIGLHPSDYI